MAAAGKAYLLWLVVLLSEKKNKVSAAFATTDPEPDTTLSDTQGIDDQGDILALFASLRLNSTCSDLTINCKGEAFSAHKLVVCPRSKYFHSAYYGGFKAEPEAEGRIYPDERNLVLIKKVLEFLYTGDYILEDIATTSINLGTYGYERQGVNTVPDYGLARGETSEQEGMHNAIAEVEELAEESAATAPETTVDGLGDGASMKEKLASIDEIPRNDPFEQGAASESSVDVLASCHPCYFHRRIYGEADYFMISDLKTKAKAHFHASFMDSFKKEPFVDTIEELYSTHADYRQLRQLAIEMRVDSLPNLRKGYFR